ncbi:MAG TPA: AI-2E family transporter, partial [Pseudomonadales bacterium]|nr:AI-2E family transporter [Pseudomonadales bacterium]
METLDAFQKMLALAVVVVFIFLLYLLQPILTPFLVGMGIAYLGDPVVDRLESVVGRAGGVLVVFLLLLILAVTGIFLLLPMLITEVATLVKSIPEFILWLQNTTRPLVESLGIDPFDINLALLREKLTENWTQVGGFAGVFFAKLTASGLALAFGIANITLIPVVGFYLMRDWDVLVGYMREILPRDI